MPSASISDEQQASIVKSSSQPAPAAAFPGYGQMSDLGSNWRIKFADADGIPLNMLSFEQIDFGAISFKEIFQNVKTILATPKFSAALERLLGVNQSIVDLPIDQAAEATIAILDALYFWEPRAEPLDIRFEPDVLAGHLTCGLKLKVRNVIYGTEQPYDRNNIFGTPTVVTQQLPPAPTVTPPDGVTPPVAVEPPTILVGVPGPPGAMGPVGPTGQRGSLWFSGTADPTPTSVPMPQPNDMYLNTTSGDIFQFNGGTWSAWKKEKP